MRIFDCNLHFFSRNFFAAMVRQKEPAADIDQVLGELAQRVKIEIPPNDLMTHLHHWLTEVFQKTRAVFGIERILFGTDSGVFPRGWRQNILEEQKQAMAGFSPAEVERLLAGNALRL